MDYTGGITALNGSLSLDLVKAVAVQSVILIVVLFGHACVAGGKPVRVNQGHEASVRAML